MVDTAYRLRRSRNTIAGALQKSEPTFGARGCGRCAGALATPDAPPQFTRRHQRSAEQQITVPSPAQQRPALPPSHFTQYAMNPEEELAQLRAEVEALRKENAKLKAQGRVDRAAVHLQAGAPTPVESPAGQALAAAGTGSRVGNKHPEVVQALKAAAEDKDAVDADLATATAWVGSAFMKVGHRFASGGMRDR